MLTASEFWSTLTYMRAINACRKHQADILTGQWTPVQTALVEIRNLHLEQNASEPGYSAPPNVIIDALNEATYDFGYPRGEQLMADWRGPANDNTRGATIDPSYPRSQEPTMFTADEFWSTLTYMRAVMICRQHRADIQIGHWEPVRVEMEALRAFHLEVGLDEIGFEANPDAITKALNEAAYDFGFWPQRYLVAPLPQS